MITIKDVAKLAGVSVSTVSRVANGTASVVPSKKQAVEKAMKELGYKPSAVARALVSNRSDSIGLLVGELGAPFFSHMMQGIDRVITESGRHVIVTSGYHSEQQERSAVEFLLARRVDALILHTKALSDEYLSEVMDSKTPVILINRLVPGYEQNCIWLDNEEGAFLATHHLLAQGHRQLGFLSTNIRNEDGESRLAGFRRAHLEFNIDISDQQISEAHPDENGGHHAMSQLLQQFPEASAVFAYNDAMAAGAITYLRDVGKSIPDDISIVGFDDVILAQLLYPRLTTIRYPIEQMGELAAKIIISRLDKTELEEQVSLRFSPLLIERQSVKACES